MYDAGKCEKPCPNGIADCSTGFCYAVSECFAQTDQGPTPQPSKSSLTETPPSRIPTTPPVTPDPTQEPTKQPTGVPKLLEPPSDEFYCGNSLTEASQDCQYACPSGSPTECPANGKCYASTGCADGPNSPPTRSPSYDPSLTFYCGSSFQQASEQCLVPCPSGISSECPPSQACYANTPCEDKNGFFCGTSFLNASATCGNSCSSGLDLDCPEGMSCYETLTCKEAGGPTTAPTRGLGVPDVEEGTKYCGYSYEQAATECSQACPSGSSEECPVGMSCFAHTPCEETGQYYCGTSWNNAASSCQYACPSGTDEECPPNTQCYAYTTCDETGSFMCGTDFENAASSCDTPCPSGSPQDCPASMSCFIHTTCPAHAEVDYPTISPTPPYIPGDSFFCGKSFLEASSQCTDPCPTRLDSECPDDEQCHGNTPCPNRETYYCGANLDEASAICEYPCPTVSWSLVVCRWPSHGRLTFLHLPLLKGDSADCPYGLSCFAFTTCATKDSFYCGNNFIDADISCDYPCQSGLSSDCPENLTCFAHTTCAVEPLMELAGPPDSYFCGDSFDEATRDCSLPCPSGSNSDCPQGNTCFSHTSCTDRDSFMCGYSWDNASGSCSNPCPSGEHDDCPAGMSCFAYTPCNNAGSFYCGTSFDEASVCDLPCPSGNSEECPADLSCFSYTSCGSGDFNPESPTESPTQIKLDPADSFYCGVSFEDASNSCEYNCPNGSMDCPTGLACFEFTSCVGRETPTDTPMGEMDSFYCGTDYADANEKCMVPCPGGTSLECPQDESCIPFTACNQPSDVTEPPIISTTFYCGSTKEDAESSCEYPCPLGAEDCPEDLSCFSFTTCPSQGGFGPSPVGDSAPSPVGGAAPSPLGDSVPSPSPQTSRLGSFYCGDSFESATSTCSAPCPSGSSSECPIGQNCFGYTSCNDRDSFYCGTSWDDAASSCSKPCPNLDECDSGEVCFGYTPCDIPETDIPIESFYCGTNLAEASMMCTDPCPSGKHSDCPDNQLCYPYTPCGERDSSFCGSSWTDAATSCIIPCPR